MPVSIFISYDREDRELREKLEKHLAPLRRQGRIEVWTDTAISPGSEVSAESREALDSAQLVLLLVSSDFLASPFCYTREMKRALEHHQAGTARVVPVILRSCDWQNTQLGKLAPLPLDGKPIKRWDDEDAALRDVVEGVKQALVGLDDPDDLTVEETTAEETTAEETTAEETTAEETTPEAPPPSVPERTATARRANGGPPYQTIFKALKAGKATVFLGQNAAGKDDWTAGSASLPSGSGIARHLALNSDTGLAPVLEDALPWVSQCYEGVMKRPTLDDEMHDIYAGRVRPEPLHRLLARFPGLLIFTLGWDRLLEEAMVQARQIFHRVLFRLGESTVRVWRAGYTTPREEPPSELDLEIGDVPVIFQLYGTAERDEDARGPLIVTERDHAELIRQLPEALPSCFARTFKQHHHLVLGCDLDVSSERQVLDQLWQIWPRKRSAWAVHEQVLPLEREHWSREHDLTIFEMPLARFVEGLERVAESD